MEKLTKDELFSLAINLDLHDILKLCSSNKKIDQRLCLRDNIWTHKLKEFPDYQQYLEDFKNMSKKEIYTLLYQLKILRQELGSPYTIYEFYKFKELDLAMRKLAEIPKEIGNLINLEILRLGNNNIEKIPKELGDLINLKTIYLTGNKIRELPKELGNLINLKELYLGYNNIEKIPKEVGNLINLKKLDLTDNKIKELPKELGKLINLRELVLDDNPIRSVPKEISSIAYLNISPNDLKIQPESGIYNYLKSWLG